MANINAGNTNDVNFGWPEAENGNAENRNMLINAMVEARITAPTPEFAQAIDVNIWAIPEYDLLAMDTAGIRTLMQDRLAALPAGATVPSDAQIDALRNQARGRQTERVAALTQIDTERTTEQRTQARERDRLNRENQDNQIAPELKAARKIFDRFGSINRDIETVDITHLLNVGNVDRTADPNDANIYPEYADGESRAYLQMMDLMFAHSGEADAVYQNNRGPQAAYLRNQELMSQDRLHVLLRNHFGLGSANFNQSVNELQQRFLRGALSRAQLGYFFSEIVIYGQQVGPRIDGGLVKQRIHAL
jgi:hypothetical protein